MATAESEAPVAVESFDPGLPPQEPPAEEFEKNLDISDPSKTPPDAADDQVPAAPDAASAKPADGKPREGEGEPAFDRELLARAEEYGFAADDFETPGQLQKLVSRMDRNISAYGRQAQKPATAPAAEEQPPAEKPAIDFAALEKLYEPELIAPLKFLHEQNEQLKAQLGQIGGHIQQQQTAAFERTFEGLIDGAAETYGEVLGKGKASALDPKGQEFTNRVQVLEEMAALQFGYQQLGRPVPPADELFSRAVRSVFADQIAKNTRHAITSRLRNDKGQFVQPPSHNRSETLPHGTERAVREVARHMRDAGMLEA